MKTLLKSALAAVVLAAPSLALASTWEFDPAHTQANFAVRHMMVSTVKGEFSKVTGTVNLDEKDITRSTVEATIDVSSIDTRHAQRDEHLRGPDFLDMKNHPTITFKSKKVEKAGEGKLKVRGDLTIRGKTKEVVLSVEGPYKPVKNPFSGALHSGISATTRINRHDFGASWNKALEAGGVLVGDEVDISLDIELIKKTPAPATAKDTK